jgi:putative transposase
MTVMKTYKYKLYRNKKNKHLDRQVEIASEIWNFSVAMRRMYYLVYGKTLSSNRLKHYITKLKRRKKYAHWNELGSQAIQDVVERVDRSYEAFFKHIKEKKKGKKSPPKFHKRSLYKSFTLKQAGYSFHEGNSITIGKETYKYSASRPFEGTVKTVTIKRTTSGDYYLVVVCQQEWNQIIPRAGKAVGYDFGLEHFLTSDDGTMIDSPLWYKPALKEIRNAHRALSHCKDGSNNRKRARQHLDRVYARISNQRRDWFFKLANQIVSENAIICIEDLNLDAMKRLWGRKVSDLAYGEFVRILQWVAFQAGTTVVKIDRWAPSSKACSVCGTINTELSLKQRDWVCDCCHTHHNRDVNAAINIRNIGLAMLNA